MSNGRGLETTLSRRAFLGGAVGLAFAGCAGIRGRKLEDLDPRVGGVLDGAISVDMHSHAAGAGVARARRFDLADHTRRGRLDLFLRRGFTPEETGKLIGGSYVCVFRQAAAARKEAA